ncbi:hypothetical protein BDW75DRAFT_247124 [Aspergillus navahoensis]
MDVPAFGKTAFVTGANGITGYAIIDHLIRQPREEWYALIDPRVQFIALDFLQPVNDLVAQMKSVTKDVTHAFFASYIHSDDFKVLRDKNVPLFRNFLDAVDLACPNLERVCLQTGGKYYGVHLGPVKVPLEEWFPRYDDQGRGERPGHNIIRPNAITGYSPQANGMSEVITVAIYMLVCQELKQPPLFPGNEYFWHAIDDNSYAPSLADMSVWAVSEPRCKNQIFNHTNGDVFVWKHIWKDFAAFLGVEAPDPVFEKASGQASALANEVDLIEWAKDKREVWERVVKKYGGRTDAFDYGTWGFFGWATGKSWLTISSVNKARKFGWARHDRTMDTWLETYQSFVNAGVLPPRRAIPTSMLS